MSSRRSRLKAVANLPVRKKNDAKDPLTETNTILEEQNNENIAPTKVIQDEQPTAVEEPVPQTETSNEQTTSKLKGPAKYNRLLRPQIPYPVRRQKQNSISESNIQNEKENTVLTKVVIEENHVHNDKAIDKRSTDVNESKTELSDTTQPESTAPDPEISENSDVTSSLVLSPKPVRTRFIKPGPRVAESARRPSIHASSASESEDDSRRNIPKIRKISESSVQSRSSTVPVSMPLPEPANNEIGQVSTITRRRRQRSVNVTVRRLAEARRIFQLKFEKEKPLRSALTMFDLIFYNPGSDSDNKVKKEKENIKFEDETALEEELVDDPGQMKKNEDADESADDDFESMPVPQVKIGPNGEIILDEKSLVVETCEARRGRENLQNAVPIYEDKSNNSYYKRKSARSRAWTDSETTRFYKALKLIGTDFSLMQTLFPTRTRMELKKKFKKEEKFNRNLINKALTSPGAFNMEELRRDLEKERMREEREKQESENIIEKKTTQQKNMAKKRAKRSSLFFRESFVKEELTETQTTQSTITDEDTNQFNTQVEVTVSNQQEKEIQNEQEMLPPPSKKVKRITRPKVKTIVDKEVDKNNPEEEFEIKRVRNEEFYKILSQNMLNLNESTIKLQITNEKDVDVIFEDVPDDLGNGQHVEVSPCRSNKQYQNTDFGMVSGGIKPIVGNDESTTNVNTERTRKISESQVLDEHSYVLNENVKGTECRPGSFLVVSNDSGTNDNVQMYMMTQNVTNPDGSVGYNTIPAVVPQELLQVLQARIEQDAVSQTC